MATVNRELKQRVTDDSTTDDNTESVYIVSLPVELLVYIISFLPTARDKVKLRYVSQRLRVVSETPSLWREFVWPLYDHREKRSVMNVLKACGDYLKRLIFSDHVTPSTLMEVLSHCSNLTQLSLPPQTKLDSEELRLAVQHMDHLEKLEVQLSTDIKPLLLIGGLKGLTVHVPEEYHSLCTPWVEEWMKKRCIPCNFNLITKTFDLGSEELFLESLLQWKQVTPLIGYTSYFKLFYSDIRPPLNFFLLIPEFELEIGQETVLPLVKASDFGILGLEWDILLLTSTIHDGKLVCKADSESPGIYSIFCHRNIVLNKVVNSLSCVTELNFAYSSTVHSGHLEQLSIACPNLERLNLDSNYSALSSLQGLRMIASHCHNLHGLNLRLISLPEIESHIGLWQLLSGIRLTHLFIDVCVFFGKPDERQQVIPLFQKCTSLQALEFDSFYSDHFCKVCPHCEVKWSLLSNFSALKYCRLVGNHPDVVQDIVNGCKQLAVLACDSCRKRLLVSPIVTTSLQQIFIDSKKTILPDVFMKMLSAHGGLVHVILSVKSVAVNGIISLIENSPRLLTLNIYADSYVFNPCISINPIEYLEESLAGMFSHKKLFNVGRLTLEHDYPYSRQFELMSGTDLFPLWPYYHPV